MGDLNDPWAGGALAQPGDRMDQLIQQVALLRDENRRLQDNVTDLRQHATQRGRPGAPAYHPDPDRYSIPRPPGWQPLGQGPVGDWDANEPPRLPISKADNDEATRALRRRARRHGPLHRQLQCLLRDIPPPIQRSVITHGGLRHLSLHQTCQALVDP